MNIKKNNFSQFQAPKQKLKIQKNYILTIFCRFEQKNRNFCKFTQIFQIFPDQILPPRNILLESVHSIVPTTSGGISASQVAPGRHPLIGDGLHRIDGPVGNAFQGIQGAKLGSGGVLASLYQEQPRAAESLSNSLRASGTCFFFQKKNTLKNAYLSRFLKFFCGKIDKFWLKFWKIDVSTFLAEKSQKKKRKKNISSKMRPAICSAHFWTNHTQWAEFEDADWAQFSFFAVFLINFRQFGTFWSQILKKNFFPNFQELISMEPEPKCASTPCSWEVFTMRVLCKFEKALKIETLRNFTTKKPSKISENSAFLFFLNL